MAEIPSIEQTDLFGAPPEKEFASLTQPKGLARGFVESAVVGLPEGGTQRSSGGPQVAIKGTVRSFTRPTNLVLEGHDRLPGGKSFDTVGRFKIRRRGKGTVLTVTHEGFRRSKAWVRLFGSVQSGWAHYFQSLKSVVGHDTDLRTDVDHLYDWSFARVFPPSRGADRHPT
jgi:uncharacterized protein YndB with AHSA1/START domain